MNPAWLLSIVELAICVLAVASLVRRPPQMHGAAAILGALLTCAILMSVARGGWYGLVTAVKVVSMSLAVLLSFRRPSLAVRALLALTLLNLLAHALQGEIGTKWSTVPFLLWCACWLYLRRMSGRPAVHALLAFTTLEMLQAWWVGSRGSVLVLGLAVGSSMLALPAHQAMWRWIARLMPVVYPVLLLLTLLSFVSDNALVTPTASNVERSSLAFWSINMMPDYLMVGPGPDAFFDNVNTALATAGRERDDDGIDPHSFLLSYWVGLGVIPMALVYAVWWRSWSRFDASSARSRFSTRIAGAIFAATAVTSFTLSAPDTYTRLVCAMCLGLACNAHRVTQYRPSKHPAIRAL